MMSPCGQTSKISQGNDEFIRGREFESYTKNFKCSLQKNLPADMEKQCFQRGSKAVVPSM